MKITRSILCAVTLVLALAACKDLKYKKNKDGFLYTVYSTGKGEKIKPGNFIQFHRTDKMDDSLLGTSYGAQPQYAPIPKDGPDLDQTAMFLEAGKGDSILLLTPVDSLIAKNPALASDSFLMKKRGKEIRTYFKIVDIYKDQATFMEAREKESIASMLKQPEYAKQKATDDAAIDAYIKANNISAAKKTNMGVAIVTTKPGNGQKANTGDYMMLRYTGKDFNGQVFDSNDKPGDQLLPFQVGAGGTIPGFADGVKTLTEGERATIIIPSLFGYGAQGSPPRIQPNQNLVFDIEVVDISDKAPAPPPMPMPDTPRK